MAEVFEKGQVWYLRFNDTVGSEEAVGRPVLIIGSDEGIKTSPVLNVVYLNTSPKSFGVTVELTTPRRRSWVLCNQITTIDKSRLRDKMCKVTDAEMLKVEVALRKVLGLPKTDSNSSSEPDMEKIAELEESLDKITMEMNMYMRLYDKALDKLAEVQFEKEKVETKKTPVVKEKVEAKKTPVVKEKKDEVKLEKKSLTKANVNKDDYLTIAKITGMSEQTAKSIVNYRNKYDYFSSLEDLTVVPRFGSGCLKMYGDKLEV